MAIVYRQLGALSDDRSSTIPYSDDVAAAMNAADAGTSEASKRLRAMSASASKKTPPAKKAVKKMAAQGGSVMIDKTIGAADVKVYQRVFGIDFPEWVQPWMVYGALGVVGAFVANYFLRGGRQLAANPLDALLGPTEGGARNGGGAAVGALERHRDRDVAEAARFRREFHWGIPARRLKQISVSPLPRVGVELGELAAVTYRTKKRGETAQFFKHDFGEGGGRRPRLIADVRNRKRLHIVGGTYTVRPEGITG